MVYGGYLTIVDGDEKTAGDSVRRQMKNLEADGVEGSIEIYGHGRRRRRGVAFHIDDTILKRDVCGFLYARVRVFLRYNF